jgi:hypothetical protein
VDDQVEHQAVTLFDGTALCRSCNERANRNTDSMQEQMAETMMQSQEQVNEAIQQLGRPGN